MLNNLIYIGVNGFYKKENLRNQPYKTTNPIYERKMRAMKKIVKEKKDEAILKTVGTQ